MGAWRGPLYKPYPRHGDPDPGAFHELQARVQVDSLQRPADIPDSGFLCDLLWD